MAYELGVQSVEGLIRNRYVGRTFIEGTNNRSDRARLKYTPLLPAQEMEEPDLLRFLENSDRA